MKGTRALLRPAAGLVPLLLASLLAAGPEPAGAACGCASMTVYTAEGLYSHPLCSSEDLTVYGCIEGDNDKLPAKYRCDEGEPYQCPLNLVAGTAPTKWFSFQVYSVLAAGSTQSECRRGQFIQSTRKKNGEATANPVAAAAPAAGTYTFGALTLEAINGPALIPAVGAKTDDDDPEYGADGYTALAFNQRYVAADRALYWWDATGGSVPLTPPSTRDEEDDFVVFVNGTAGAANCWCRFSLNQRWEEDTGAGGAGRIAGSASCTLVTESAEDQAVLGARDELVAGGGLTASGRGALLHHRTRLAEADHPAALFVPQP